jgi:serine/threonine-protein kinase
MATIYLGCTSEESGAVRLAAIKVIRHELRADKRFVHMFLDEARVLSRLSHPNIAAIYEYGVDEEQHFIAMELLLGRTLADVWDACKQRRLSLRLDHAAWIAARTADALHYAHALAGEDGRPLHLVHRDVNPSNIFLTFNGEVKLFDFGLAKSTGRKAQSSTGIVKGKLTYLSPEQVTSLTLDHRSDIYTLGTTLWEMTTMRRLFKRKDDVETLMAVRAGLVPHPRATVPTYPEDLWAIVRRALSRNRDERYQTAAELARDLDAFVAAQAAKKNMPELTSAILDALFPGEREQRRHLLRRASATSQMSRTSAPQPSMPPKPSSKRPSAPSSAPTRASRK